MKFTKDISLSLDCDESDEATDAFAWERMDPLLAFLRDDAGRDEAFDIDLGVDFEDVAARAAAAATAAEWWDVDGIWGNEDRRVTVSTDDGSCEYIPPKLP